MDGFYVVEYRLLPGRGREEEGDQGSERPRDYDPAIHTNKPIACRAETTKPSLWDRRTYISRVRSSVPCFKK